MSRTKLPRAIKKCERDGCENTFITRVGAKYQQRYCSSRCAALDKPNNRMFKVHYRKPKREYVNKQERSRVVNIHQLQNCPINFDSRDGKFVRLCNDILQGKLRFAGVDN